MDLTINWNRAIYVDGVIDDAMVARLAPHILCFKQNCKEPITIAINSPGGSLFALKNLLGLLESPDQDGNRCEFITVVTNEASSAAATLLANGDYSVAHQHSSILCHDSRYRALETVTKGVAIQAANDLEARNRYDSLKFAHSISRRIVWNYIDLSSNFARYRADYDKLSKKYDDHINEYLGSLRQTKIDVVGLALTLYHQLSVPIDKDIALDALESLADLLHIEQVNLLATKNNSECSTTQHLLAGFELLATHVSAKQSAGVSLLTSESSTFSLTSSAREDLQLFLGIIARRAGINPQWSFDEKSLDTIKQEFFFVKNMRDISHIDAITSMARRHASIFFDEKFETNFNAASTPEEKAMVMTPVYPEIQMFWFYIVLIATKLFDGDHYLTAADAQLLGIVDEILGGGPVQSRREFRKSQELRKTID